MSELYLHNRRISSVFQLLGVQENDMTYSLGWALANSRPLLSAFVSSVIGEDSSTKGTTVRLQHHEPSGGFTDIEIASPGQYYIIVEAKRGWNLPSPQQLGRYAPRLRNSPEQIKRLVVLSECSREYAELKLQPHNIGGVQVDAIPWSDVIAIAKNAQAFGTHAEKRLMRELLTYLTRLVTMQDVDSNKVYVVALAQGKPRTWDISWIDIVKNKGMYFHPFGVGGWPKAPPNYLAFRYHGKLQSIHHVDDYQIVTNMHSHIPDIPEGEWKPHFLYTLGPAFRPKELRTGNIYRNGRVWCMLDTLFTCDTIAEARDLTKQREATEA